MVHFLVRHFGWTNLAAYNYVRRTARPEIAGEQYAVIAPRLHCAFKSATEHTKVGERDVGDARLDYDPLTFRWFDHFLKGEDNDVLESLPKVRYYAMGSNKWQSSDTWPPEGAKPEVWFYPARVMRKRSTGDGVLSSACPETGDPDEFTYDPMHPVPTHGGVGCCDSSAVSGAADQRNIEERNDVLVFSSDALDQGIGVSGPIEVTLFVSSDVKDTDITAKIRDVCPDGTAYNLDETIPRLRCRNGYESPPEWMEKGKVYKVTRSPMNTSNYFSPGHRIRLEISSSNFPRFDRNLNTGGNNYHEAVSATAHTWLHHSRKYPSRVTMSVVPGKKD